MVIAGLPKKAEEYINNNSKFVKGKSVGCIKSHGTLDFSARMYKIEKVGSNSIALFEYDLISGLSKTKIQKIVDKNVFISLETADGKEIKWRPKEIKNYLSS